MDPENESSFGIGSSSDGGKGATAAKSAEEVDARARTAFLRSKDEIGAMGAGMRFRTRLRNMFSRICCLARSGTNTEVVDGDLEEGKDKQYRLASINREQYSGALHRFLCCSNTQSTMGGIGVSPNQALAMYLHWMFRVNFFILFSLSCFFFFGMVIFFSAFIVIAGTIDSDCVRIGSNSFGEADSPFADAFALSWTTLSTVGYGSTYPALAHENDNPTNCAFITIICSLESFVGVLYSGFCGAILFGKILRIQSHAQVIFSDPIVIRYGTGVETNSYPDDDEDHSDDGEWDQKKQSTIKKIACPVLEFRIVNRLFDEISGEIMDASLNVVANVDANDADPVHDMDMSQSNHRSAQGESEASGVSTPATETSAKTSGWNVVRSSIKAKMFQNAFIKALEKPMVDVETMSRHGRAVFPGSFRGPTDTIFVENHPTANFVSKHIFSKMIIEASEHPFFKRVWLARHVLDDSSPLLSPQVRRLIRRNQGFWPENLNSHDGVRESLKFNQILVSLNGVSNVSAADVYAQKIYDFIDVNIGYQFVNLLYRGDNGQLKVDMDLINDVREQTGGGGEPLTFGEDDY